MAATVTPLGTPGTVSTVTVTAGVPTAGSGTISTLDNIFNATNGPIDILPASTAALATHKAVVVAISPNGQNLNGQNTAANSTPVVLPSNPLSASPNGLTSSRILSAANVNANNLKSSAGNIARIDLFNTAAYDVFFKIYNKASGLVVGTDTPVWTIPLKAGTGYATSFPIGKSFAAGISFGITKLQADADTTIIAAGDVTGSIDWI